MPSRAHTFGLELELFLIDRDGRVAFEAPALLQKLKQRRDGDAYAKEAGEHMLELLTTPNTSYRPLFAELVRTVRTAKEQARAMGLLLQPFATYPGRYNPHIRENPWYQIQSRILGEDKFATTGMCTGFHFHYSMPEETFHKPRRHIKATTPEIDRRMVSSYNLLIAADPALTTFMQSSPFIQGTYLAKDSRMLFYRGGTNLKYDGLYSHFQLFGGLESYTRTVQDIIRRIEKRYDLWKSALLSYGFDANLIRRYGRKLDYAWNPVKVNKHGTLEQRGMDANLPSYVAGAGLLIQRMLHRVNTEHLRVNPSTVGVREPFKLEGDILHVPTARVVLRDYQYRSAMHGLADPSIYRYAKALYRFASARVPPSERPLLRRIRRMLATKRTMTDQLIGDAAREGFTPGTRIRQHQASALALRWSDRLTQDLKEVSQW